MVNSKGNVLFKLLLIITMVIQPMAVSYAMSSMHHAAHQIQHADQGFHHAHNLSHEQAAAIQPQQDQEAGTNGVMNDCCNSAACCPAAVVAIEALPQAAGSFSFVALRTSWGGIDLPAEIRPPRTLLG